ncbi:ABC transporter permease [Schumannella luteola]
MSPLEFWTVVLAGALALSAPVIIAGLGEVVLERAGGFNVGIEGMMLVGAITSVLVARESGPWLGLIAGLLAGAAAGALFAGATVLGGADVVIVGIAIGLLGSGLSVFLFQWLAPEGAAATTVETLPRIVVLEGIPIIGAVLSGGGVVFLIAVVLSVATWAVLRYTRFGLRLRAVGSTVNVAGVRGLSTRRYQAVAAIIAGASAGLAGASIPLGTIGTFTPNMTGGAGFIALAVVIIARQNPLLLIVGALLFAVFNSLALFAQTQSLGLPVEVYQALPYLVTIIVLSVVSRRLLVRSRRWRGEPVPA